METNHDNQETVNVQAGIDKVYQSMINWETYRNVLTDVSGYFSQGNMFEFTVNMNGSPYLHTYPAVTPEGKLVFEVIASDNDVMRNFTALIPPPNVTTIGVKTKTMPVIVGGPIPQSEAVARVANWNNITTRNLWMTTETINRNMYQCFVIPGADIVSGVKHAAYFALRVGEEGEYIADLIIINLASNQIVGQSELGTVYYDMTRPVPPYKPLEGRERINFGLLNYVESIS